MENGSDGRTRGGGRRNEARKLRHATTVAGYAIAIAGLLLMILAVGGGAGGGGVFTFLPGVVLAHLGWFVYRLGTAIGVLLDGEAVSGRGEG